MFPTFEFDSILPIDSLLKMSSQILTTLSKDEDPKFMVPLPKKFFKNPEKS